MDNSPASDVSPQPSAPPAPDAPSSTTPATAPAPIATPVPGAPVAPVAPTAPAAPAINEKIANITGQTVDAIKGSFMGGSAAITSLIIGASIAFLVAFVLYWIITRAANPLNKITYQVPDTKIPKTGYEVNQVTTEGLPSLKDYATISFWLYVNEFSDVPMNPNITELSIYRHVWHRGDSKWSPETVTPLVLLKSTRNNTTKIQKNSLIVSFKPSNANSLFDGATFNPTNPSLNTKIEYMLASRGIVIDYIPVKRWVHISVTVNRKSKIMKAFVDGENVNTKDTTGSVTVNGVTTGVTRKVSIAELNGSGDIFIGGRPTSDLGLGFSGLVSNIRYSNWDMSNSEVYREYKRGPIDNLLSRMGLPAYGVQSPIYKIL